MISSHKREQGQSVDPSQRKQGAQVLANEGPSKQLRQYGACQGQHGQPTITYIVASPSMADADLAGLIAQAADDRCARANTMCARVCTPGWCGVAWGLCMQT